MVDVPIYVPYDVPKGRVRFMPSTAGRRYVTPSVEAWRHRLKLLCVMEELEAEDEKFRPLHDFKDTVFPKALALHEALFPTEWSSYMDEEDAVWMLNFLLPTLIDKVSINGTEGLMAFLRQMQINPISGEEKLRPLAEKLKKSLLAWKIKWNLPSWFRFVVVETLKSWLVFSNSAEQLGISWDEGILSMDDYDVVFFLVERSIVARVDNVTHSEAIAESKELVAKLLDLHKPRKQEIRFDWLPLFESRQEARDRISALFNYELEKYLDQIESQCEALGLKPESGKYEKGERHYLWFIRHVFQGWTYERIADEESVLDSATVRKAVTDLGKRMKTPVERNTYFDAVPSVT